MALFQTREAWSSRGCGDEHDAHGFVAGVVGGRSVVVSGSLSGLVRIHCPGLREQRVEDLLLEQQLGEPVLQVELGRFVSSAPNTQALAVLHPRSVCVFAIVERADAGVLALELRYSHALGGEGGQHFSACNMVCGPFGGVKGRDFLAVQSLDGQLSVYECEAFAFARQLNHVLLPGPLCYVAKMDSLLVGNSAFQVDCYKYHMLAASSTAVAPSRLGAAAGGEAAGADAPLIATDWTFTVGEQVLDVRSARLSRGLPLGQVDIVVLAERSIYCLSERGQVRAHVKLDVGCNPLCCCSTSAPDADSSSNRLATLVVASETGQLSVYREFELVWAASVRRHVPVAITTARVDGVDGVLVSMSDDGLVLASYLGTAPATDLLVPRRAKVIPKQRPVQELAKQQQRNEAREGKEAEGKAQPPPARAGLPSAEELRRADDLEYEEMDAEHRKLLDKIRVLHKTMSERSGSGSGIGGAPHASDAASAAASSVLVRVQLPSTLDELSLQDNSLARSEDAQREFAYRPDGVVVQLTAKVFLSLRGAGELRDVHVAVRLPEPFVCADNAFVVERLRGAGAEPTVLLVPVRCRSNLLVASLQGQVVLSHRGQRGNLTKVQRSEFRLPLFLAARLRPSVKNDAAKVTLETSEQDSARLAVLFDDMLRQPAVPRQLVEQVAGGSSNVVSLELFDGSNVTVLAAKSGGRYRVQGAALPHLWLMAEELNLRLREQARATDSAQLAATSEPLPLPGLMLAIERHHAARIAKRRAASAINDRAQQYRLVQRRLLSRFKDKAAPPLQALDKLLMATHEQIVADVAQLEIAQRQLAQAAKELEAAIRLVLMLCGLKHPHLDEHDRRALHAALAPDVHDVDGADMGWEEIVDASVTHLLRTTLAKQPKAIPPAGATADTRCSLEMQPDATKLTKHLAIFFDRIAKGARPHLAPPEPASSS